MTNGWIKLHRQIQDNEFWYCEKFTRGQAWVDLLLMANHDEATFFVRGNKVTVQRGFVGHSEQTLSEKWKWSRGKVRRFIKQLETVQQIVQHKSSVLSLIEVKNYDLYQSSSTQSGTTDSTTERQQTVQQTDTNKKVKKNKNENNTTSMSANADVLNEFDEFVLWINKQQIFPNAKQPTPAARKKWSSRRRTYPARQLAEAFANLLNEPDKWKVRNNGQRPLAWWLHSDERIEDMLGCHLKQSSRKRGVAIITQGQ